MKKPWRWIVLLGMPLLLIHGCADYGTNRGEDDGGETDNGGVNNGDDFGEENIANTCDDCPRLWAPVCGIDFVNYDNACFADCLGSGWWHIGECLEGEGAPCYSLCGVPCAQGLTCLGGYCGEAPNSSAGMCILAGSCVDAGDCRAQILPHDECAGEWACRDHVCAWECD